MERVLFVHQACALGADVAYGVEVPVQDQVTGAAVIDPLPQRELGSRCAP